jgi:hypothetical protein
MYSSVYVCEAPKYSCNMFMVKRMCYFLFCFWPHNCSTPVPDEKLLLIPGQWSWYYIILCCSLFTVKFWTKVIFFINTFSWYNMLSKDRESGIVTEDRFIGLPLLKTELGCTWSFIFRALETSWSSVNAK